MTNDRFAPMPTLRTMAQQWISLDGYASGVHGEEPLFNALTPEADAHSQEWNERLLDDVDEVLLGRKTYESFVRFWPEADLPIAARVNSISKVVFSRTLVEAPWGQWAPARVDRKAVEYVQRKRRAGSGRLLVWGSLSLMHELIRVGELDELDLFVAPVILGAGTPLSPPGFDLQLKQRSVQDWRGAVHLTYSVTRE